MTKTIAWSVGSCLGGCLALILVFIIGTKIHHAKNLVRLPKTCGEEQPPWTDDSDTVDAVVTYVDAKDKDWQQLKQEYINDDNDLVKYDNTQRWNDQRGQDAIEEIELCLLSILLNMPFVRKIHLVLQRPQMCRSLYSNNILRKAHIQNKINIVYHDEFIPNSILPVFNSNAIEAHLHLIPNLSEKFVYFNDDVICLKPVSPSQLFYQDK